MWTSAIYLSLKDDQRTEVCSHFDLNSCPGCWAYIWVTCPQLLTSLGEVNASYHSKQHVAQQAGVSWDTTWWFACDTTINLSNRSYDVINVPKKKVEIVNATVSTRECQVVLCECYNKHLSVKSICFMNATISTRTCQVVDLWIIQ